MSPEDKFRELQESVFYGLQMITFISIISLTLMSKISLFYMYKLIKQHFKINQRALKFKLYYNVVTKAMLCPTYYSLTPIITSSIQLNFLSHILVYKRNNWMVLHSIVQN